MVSIHGEKIKIVEGIWSVPIILFFVALVPV